MIEIIVKISDSERTMTQKFLHYDDPISMSQDDECLKAYVNEALEKFGTHPFDVLITTKYVWGHYEKKKNERL